MNNEIFINFPEFSQLITSEFKSFMGLCLSLLSKRTYFIKLSFIYLHSKILFNSIRYIDFLKNYWEKKV